MASLEVGSHGVVVSGNTYPIKDQLKKIGLRWDWNQRAWVSPNTSDLFINRIQHVLGVAEKQGEVRTQSRISFSSPKQDGNVFPHQGYPPLIKIHFDDDDDDLSKPRKNNQHRRNDQDVQNRRRNDEERRNDHDYQSRRNNDRGYRNNDQGRRNNDDQGHRRRDRKNGETTTQHVRHQDGGNEWSRAEEVFVNQPSAFQLEVCYEDADCEVSMW